MKVEVLGDECKKCRILYDNVRQAVAESVEQVEVVRTNAPYILPRYGVRSLPGLVIDGGLKASGKFLSVAQVRDLLGRKTSERGSFSRPLGGRVFDLSSSSFFPSPPPHFNP